ncbi:MAG: hypothetical protein ACK5N8_08640 [Alphaproteobacteria bacterium]
MTDEKRRRKRTLLEIIKNKKIVLARKLMQKGKKTLFMGGLLAAMSLTTKSASAQAPVKDKKLNKSELLADAAKPDAKKMAEYMMYATIDIDETINDVVENDILTFQHALEKKFKEIERYKGNRKRKFGGGLNYCAMIPSRVFKEVAVRDSMDYVKDLYGSLSNPNLCSAVRDDIKAMYPESVSKRQKVSEMKNLKNGDFLIIDMKNARAGHAETSTGLHFVTYFEGKFYELTSDSEKEDLSKDNFENNNVKGEILSVNRETYKGFDDSYFSTRYGWKISTSDVLKQILNEKIYDLSQIEKKKYVFAQSARIGEEFDYYKQNQAKKIVKQRKQATLLEKKKKAEKEHMGNLTFASTDLSVPVPESSIAKDFKKLDENIQKIRMSQQKGKR